MKKPYIICLLRQIIARCGNGSYKVRYNFLSSAFSIAVCHNRTHLFSFCLHQMEESWKRQEAFTGEEDHSNDMLRTMLLETNPYLLAVTGIVSMLHTVFDILAFKNDISFFKNKKSMEGLSLRSMIVNCFFSLVILLYLADNDTK